jgi:hypothetical protein
MYNHSTVLKAAELFPAHPPGTTRNSPTPLEKMLEREIYTVKGKFSHQNAEAMSDAIREKDISVMFPSVVNETGWKELSLGQYSKLSGKK